MRLASAIIQLPLRFDAARLAEECAALADADWRPGSGDESDCRVLPLIAPGTESASAPATGAMRPTPPLARSPYLRQVLAAFDSVLGHARLVRFAAEARGSERVDLSGYGLRHARVHIPLLGHPEIRIVADASPQPLRVGEPLLIDPWHRHRVDNPAGAEHVHLVIDLVGSAGFWELVPAPGAVPVVPRRVAYDPNREAILELEAESLPVVMTPGELEQATAELLTEADRSEACAPDQLDELRRELERLTRDWRGLFARFGSRAAGWPSYRQLLDATRARLAPMHDTLVLWNGAEMLEALEAAVLQPALDPTRAAAAPAPTPQPTPTPAAALATTPDATPTPEPAPAADADTPDPGAPLRSIHTRSLATLLEELGVSLLVSTYQAGKLIVVRSDDGVVNTHFRVFSKPMGMAADRERLVLGTSQEVLDFRNQRDLAAKLDPPGKHDACYVIRGAHVTGNIDIHELALIGDEVWLVNTRFSSLCTLDAAYSFVPRWSPRFITRLAPEDRCHLNGLGVEDGRVRWLTALGETDTPGGWRENKPSGGILIDRDSGEIVVRGLSMPHSPRRYRGQLFVLESGRGRLAAVDERTGRLETVTQLPGFTRGLAFAGRYAFVGLSQVRETAVFSGLPLTEQISERTCGVWVVDLETGTTVGFLKFEAAVQEIFAVEVLPTLRFPEVLPPNAPQTATTYTLPT